MTYELVLIRSHCRENRLRENKRPELFRLQIIDSDVRGTDVGPKHEVYTWLVSMHGIQDDLHDTCISRRE